MPFQFYLGLTSQDGHESYMRKYENDFYICEATEDFIFILKK
jgi:hypothetical protein